MPKTNRLHAAILDHFRVVTSCLIGLLLAGYFCASAAAAVPVLLMPVPRPQYFSSNGLPLANGCVFAYAVNSTNPIPTYTDNTGAVQNSNPTILGTDGTASIWIQAGVAYTIVVKASGGLNCASGSTRYTVDGIGGGATTLTTVVTYSATPTFAIQAQNQLFQITLTGNASSQPLTAVGIVPPGLVTWEITQDGAGAHTFTWPANSVGGCTIGSSPGQVTLQHFIWDGTTAIATGPCVTGNGPAVTAGSITDTGLTPSAGICADANKQISSACTAILSVTYNGQTVAPGGSGNVNAGAANHSLAINKGAGAAIAGLTMNTSQIPIGSTGADPSASTLPTCTASQALTYTGTPPLTCVSAGTSTNAASGKITFASGLIFQWATGPSRGNSEGTDTTNLLSTCPTAIDNVQVSYVKESPGTGADDAWYQIDSTTTSTVVTFKQGTGGTLASSHPFVFVVCH